MESYCDYINRIPEGDCDFAKVYFNIYVKKGLPTFLRLATLNRNHAFVLQ